MCGFFIIMSIYFLICISLMIYASIKKSDKCSNVVFESRGIDRMAQKTLDTNKNNMIKDVKKCRNKKITSSMKTFLVKVQVGYNDYYNHYIQSEDSFIATVESPGKINTNLCKRSLGLKDTFCANGYLFMFSFVTILDIKQI